MKTTLIKFISCLILFLGLATTVCAQLSAGIRFGRPSAVCARLGLGQSGHIALEGIAAYESGSVAVNFGSLPDVSWSAVSVSAIFQFLKPVGRSENLKYSYDWGIGYMAWGYEENDFGLETEQDGAWNLQVGAGLHYTFPNLPIELSADWLPRIQEKGPPGNTVQALRGSVGLRYILQR